MLDNKKIKNYIDNLKVWDELVYQWVEYKLTEIEGSLYELDNWKEYKYVDYWDLFDELMKNAIDDLVNNNLKNE